MIALIFTICAAILIVCMFYGIHYRYTNALMLASGLDLLSSLGLWFYLSGVYQSDVSIGPSFYIVISVSLLQFICYLGCRYFTAKLYDANLLKIMLQNDDSESDEETQTLGDEEESVLKTEVDEEGNEIDSEEEETPTTLAASKKDTMTPAQLEKLQRY